VRRIIPWLSVNYSNLFQDSERRHNRPLHCVAYYLRGEDAQEAIHRLLMNGADLEACDSVSVDRHRADEEQ
jgi:hypothetical protein